jgi:hypothetical protein
MALDDEPVHDPLVGAALRNSRAMEDNWGHYETLFSLCTLPGSGKERPMLYSPHLGPFLHITPQGLV